MVVGPDSETTPEIGAAMSGKGNADIAPRCG